MKLVILSITILLSLRSFAGFDTCKCELDFQKQDGSQYSESVEVSCPDSESASDLECSGDLFSTTLTANCKNKETGENKSESTFSQDAEPLSSSPNCSL